MEPFFVEKSDKHVLILASSPLRKFHDFVLFLAALLFLDFQIKLILGPDPLLSAKLSFLSLALTKKLAMGHGLASLPYLLPLSVMLTCLITLGLSTRWRFDGISHGITYQKNFYGFTIQRKEIPFASVRQIILEKRDGKNQETILALDEGGEKKTILEKSSKKESVRRLAKKIQEIIHLPIHQKLHF